MSVCSVCVNLLVSVKKSPYKRMHSQTKSAHWWRPTSHVHSDILINEHTDVVLQVRGVGGGGEGQQQRGNHDVRWPM